LRFNIPDLLWLVLVVAMATVWSTDRWRQGAKMQALEEISGLEANKFFPNDWEGKMAAFRNQIAILRMRITELTRELESRGHRVELDDCGHMVVDRPFSRPLFPVHFGQSPNQGIPSLTDLSIP
jgi:hypothetical protein